MDTAVILSAIGLRRSTGPCYALHCQASQAHLLVYYVCLCWVQLCILVPVYWRRGVWRVCRAAAQLCRGQAICQAVLSF